MSARCQNPCNVQAVDQRRARVDGLRWILSRRRRQAVSAMHQIRTGSTGNAHSGSGTTVNRDISPHTCSPTAQCPGSFEDRLRCRKDRFNRGDSIVLRSVNISILGNRESPPRCGTNSVEDPH